ncbi:MAG: cell division protein FtsW [Micavibrio sp.]|nr:cell division protein FtsW [Micavibrio sp.]|tara:strand:+ start:53052 stop:54209 length:1158 start_codon:yes stop_codon:yes gene_type:complete
MNVAQFFSRTDKSVISNWFWTVDKGALVSIFALIVYGLILVATASPSVALRIGVTENHFLIRHIVFLIPALIMMIGVSMISPRNLWRLATVIYIGGILAMLLIPFVGMEIKGAKRWLHLLGLGLQPSEIVKPAFAIVAAWLMAMQKERENFTGDLYAAGLYAVFVALLLLQPDFGMTMVVTCMFATQIFLAGLRFRYLAIMFLAGLCLLMSAYYGFDHVQSRIDRFMNPAAGDNFQVNKSLESFQNGGILGTGPGQGSVKMYLPDAHADFIFSVAGEELGFIFTFLLAGLFLFILLRGFNHLMDTEDIFTIIACGGLLAMIGLQALVHICSSLNLIPTKGMTLPFISYGGTSLLSVGFAFGAVLSLTRHKKRSGIVKGKTRKRIR